MKNKLKGVYLLLSSIIIAILHLPFAFGKNVFGSRTFSAFATTGEDSTGTGMPVMSVYDSLHLETIGLSRQAFDYAQKGWNKLFREGKLSNDSILAIADFSQPSSQKRLYILDLKEYKVLFNTLVAHGRNSGKEVATSFSNSSSSYKSSPGFYVTGETYNGKHGYSLKLNGVEKGINDNAYNRAIVVHGADYVDESYVANQGYIGRSQGCPAVPEREAQPIINTIKNNTCFFIYEPGKSYTSRSAMLN
ncbi:murein L,D-transpeptidase catalytic domain family protein [Terrimonas sp. NA20]|uniref:Murein L,D-transpeptidase catalytic domain family protein n=1 Tax=Terrimonas ginsenosidimutans TaxID=2908004 RepID=A0ABS9KTY5_9BACT|nr:murein L,D-transpeptidase catalytic domain family protein [Terrimonas ginsenosidimutans]MCG2615788.1 murein L,D-transpeptidase catalytic domain family protein [Terrimonas ginsenosidimutans]